MTPRLAKMTYPVTAMAAQPIVYFDSTSGTKSVKVNMI